MSCPIGANFPSTAYCDVLPPLHLNPLPLSLLPHQGVVLLDLPADEVMAREDRVLKKDRKEEGRKEETIGDV